MWREGEPGNVCAKCGTDRFDNKGKPQEFVVWFPLRERLEQLLSLQQFCNVLRHENRRPEGADPDLMTDVYDCVWWDELMGSTIENKITRIGLLLCIDGFPAFHQKHKGAPSLSPAEFVILSLPPSIRYDPDNILMWMLIPDTMSASKQFKYFKYVCTVELNPLQVHGVPGPDGPVLVKLFGASLDLKGKEKFYNQISVVGYSGCSTCIVHYDQGPAGAIYGCARRFLPRGHPLRRKDCTFQGLQLAFRNEELQEAPPKKTTQTVFKLATQARARRVTHYLGQKGLPMLMAMLNFRYDRFNVLEWMHNLKCSFDNFVDMLIGRDDNGKWDLKSRTTSKALGVFPKIWIGQVKNLSVVRHTSLASLTNDVINRAQAPWLRRWLSMCGIRMDRATRIRELRDRVITLRDTAARGDPIPVSGLPNPLPWRLSPQALAVVNERTARLCYPHYTPVCHIGCDSFFKRTGCWRTATKLLAFLVILVPVLQGFVKPFREGLRRVVYGLRIIAGQTCSVNEAAAFKLETTNIYLRKSDINKARLLIIEGLSIIEASCPICLLVPAVHTLCHYGDGAALWGLLRLLWMMNFERYNKKCKNLTVNKKFPFKSLSNALVRDATARYYRWRRSDPITREDKEIKTELCGVGKPFILPRILSNQIKLICGCRVEHSLIFSHLRASIGGIRFTAGEPLIPGVRCGSVVIRVVHGRSLYGLVKKFVRVICECHRSHDFVVVTWLPPPVYPDGDPLTVHIHLRDGVNVNTMTNETVSSLDDIQPSRVIVDMNRSGLLSMMRIEGTDNVV